MKKNNRSGHIGILTSGGDTPGLNAAIRGLENLPETVDPCRLSGSWMDSGD